jgi:hypothetical protein
MQSNLKWRRGPYQGGNRMLIVSRRTVSSAFDSEALAWVQALETLDGQALESGVRNAINAFVVGCKADQSPNAGVSNWQALEHFQLYRGPRTLPAALYTPKGPAVTNVGFTLSINLNRGASSDGQNNASMWIWVNQAATTNTTRYIGAQNSAGISRIMDQTGTIVGNVNSLATNYTGPPGSGQRTGFIGVSRASASQFTMRYNSTDFTVTSASVSPISLNYFLFARNNNGTPDGHTDAGVSAAASGKAVNLALMEARVATLLAAIAAAIP